jgi:hypothetical protein
MGAALSCRNAAGRFVAPLLRQEASKNQLVTGKNVQPRPEFVSEMQHGLEF